MLQKQTITIPLGLGVNTKTDEKLVEQGAFNLVCENATFEKVGAVKKRQGYGVYSTSSYSNSSAAGSASVDYASIYSPTCVAGHNKSLILRNITGDYLYYHEGAFIYNSSNKLPEIKVTSVPLYTCQTTIDHSDTDYDSYEDIVIAVGREGNQDGDLAGNSTNGSTLVLYDVATESKVSTSKIESGGFSDSFGFVRCGFTRVSGESYYYNIAVDTAQNLIIKIFNKYGQEHSTSFSISGIENAGAVTVGGLAVCRSSDDQSLYIIASTTTANTGKFVALSGTTKTYETTFTTSGTMSSISAIYDSALIHVVYATGRKIILNPDGTVNSADAAVTGLSLSSVAYDQDSVNVIIGRYDGGYNSWTGGTQSTENDNTLLMSDKVSISGIPLVVGKSDYNLNSNIEATYFALGYAAGTGRSGQKTYARFADAIALTADGDRDRYYEYIPARFAKISSSKCAIALPRLVDVVDETPGYQLQLYILEASQDYKSNSRAIIGKNLHFSGGFLAEFDGVNMFENGFHTPPAMPTLDVSGGSALTGTFSYKLVYKYVDKNGQISRSAPSLSASTGSITSKDVVITMSSNPFGVKLSRCSVEVYRTTNGGTTFYYVTETPIDAYSGSSLSIYTDTTSDSMITDNAILYTSGDVLPNDSGPACKFLVQGGNRLILGGLEDDNEIAYSKKKLFGESVNLSDFFRVRVDTSQFNIAGGVTALGYMDGKIIIFKENSIFYVSGDGPNELGQNDTFTSPELISSDTGCTDPRSVVLCPLGLLFKGEKGIYLLGRGLDCGYIGAGVESYNDYNITSAVHLSKKNEVRFTLKDSGTTNKYILVYDYFTQQWSVDNGILALDGDIVDGYHVVLDQATSAPIIQNVTTFLDKGATYSTKIKTPWIKVSGLQDFGRIWTATILGKYKSAHTLNVKAYYDYSTDYVEEFNITPASTDDQYQYRIHLKKQKCESVQFEIQDTNQTGESMELTALTLEVGLRKGSFKINAGRKY